MTEGGQAVQGEEDRGRGAARRWLDDDGRAPARLVEEGVVAQHRAELLRSLLTDERAHEGAQPIAFAAREDDAGDAFQVAHALSDTPIGGTVRIESAGPRVSPASHA